MKIQNAKTFESYLEEEKSTVYEGIIQGLQEAVETVEANRK
jgi:hypothetical protein